MKILIADDEKLARLRLNSLIAECGTVFEVVAEAKNGVETLQKWKQTQPDVLLLDIRMPELNGLQVAQELLKFAHPPAVIFTTAYDSYALQAFEANAIDYLLKPIRKDRLVMALQKAQVFKQAQLQLLQKNFPNQQRRTHLCVQIAGDLHLLPVEEILYFQADQKYVMARTREKEYLLDDSLKALEEEFADLFLRIHRNALVSLRHIEDLHKEEDGQVLVKFHHFAQTLAVSRRLLSKVKACFKDFKLNNL
jgi:two-component system, LytTR family, response regulator AlgR